MANTKDKVYDAAANVKPYVERAMSDDQLRTDVLSAFNAAKELYAELTGTRRDAVGKTVTLGCSLISPAIFR